MDASAPLTAVTARRRGPAPPSREDASGLLALGRYRFHRPLGAGGFGTVWLARDERLQRDVAVKMLPRERIASGRFEREARAAARLSHPGIVTLYEAAVDDDAAYLVSELVRGTTLWRLQEAGRLSDRDVLEIGLALCDALIHAHGQGVVHRDVKPSNVLVPEHPASQSEVAKLTDFGVARVLGTDTLTRTGDVIGTLAYMAPEQAEGREAAAPADLFALALVLYEALTGTNPVATGTAAQRARRLGAHLPPLRRQRRDLPRELGQALDTALSPRPRERGGITELKAALLGGLDRVEDTPGLVSPPRGSAWSQGEREPPQLEGEPFLDVEPAAPRLRLGWPARGLAGASAALIGGWVVGEMLAPPPAAPLALALAGGVAVATLPRLGWLALMVALTGSLAFDGRAGAALVVGLATLLPLLVLFRRPAAWPLAALAPALGAAGLAGAWPALAGRASSLWRRASLGALGWVWTVCAAALSGHGLYTRLPRALPPSSAWTGSLGPTIRHVLPSLCSPGLLGPALVWAGAAAVLPLLRVRAVALQVVLVTVWSAGLASATVTILRSGHAAQPKPGVVALGAIAGALVALFPLVLERWRRQARASDTVAGLA